MLFDDYPHKIEEITIDGELYLHKSLANRGVLRKEYEVTNFVSELGVGPAVRGWYEDHYIEKKLMGVTLDSINFNDMHVTQLAINLSLIHNATLPTVLEGMLYDELSKKGDHRASVVFEAMVSVHPKILPVEVKKLASKFFLTRDVLFTDQKFSLIHGDLTKNNILVSSNNVFFIDWADARFDLPSIDVAQLFFSALKTEKAQRLFIANYTGCELSCEILKTQEALILVYCLCHWSCSSTGHSEEWLERLLEIVG